MKTQDGDGAVAVSTEGAHRRATWSIGRFAGVLAAGLALFVVAAPAFADQIGVGGNRGVSAMQANLYVGGDIARVATLDPTDPNYLNNLVMTVTGVYYEIVASQPAVRVRGVADEIAARMPDIVSVEEASLIRNQSPGDLAIGGTSPATNVVYDYLEMLLDDLQARGAHYAVASVTYGFDAEMPMKNLQTGTIDDIRLTDREAILVRTDLPPGQFRVTNPQGGNFQAAVVTASGLRLDYGWCSVDVFVRGQNFRYICPHLMTEDAPQIQVLQAEELLVGPANVGMPVIMLGDYNTDPFHRDGSIAYDNFSAAGFSDAWAALNSQDPLGGLTWGHDEFLADPTNPFIERVDLAFYRGAGFVPVEAEVIDMALDRTQAPLWASDHKALAVKFQLVRAPIVRARPGFARHGH